MPANILFALMLLFSCLAQAAGNPVKIGLDAEFGLKSSNSAQAVEQGIRIAIEEINQAGGVLNGRPLELVTRDNRAITAIGKDNFQELAAIPDLVAIFGGKISPVYVECVPLAQSLGVPLLDPWGSADPIIDHSFRPSFIFRLSLKDAWAGPAFLKFAREAHGATRLGLILPNTAWGRSNRAAIRKAAEAEGTTLVGERWYNWGDTSLIAHYRELRAAGAQAIVLIANEIEGSVLIREVGSLPVDQRLPIVSHWGVTGGDFARLSGDALGRVDLAVIQTFSFVGANGPAARRVLTAMQRLYGIDRPDEVRSPVGVAHAYDLTHLLARAVNAAGSTDRRKIREALEQLGPYEGLVQRYARPFTADRHEALSPANIFFARYTDGDRLIPIGRRPPR